MKVTEYTQYRGEEEIITRIEEQDSKNNIIEEIDFDQEGQMLLKTTYKYNNQDKAVEITQYDEENNLIEKKSIEFDEKGKKSGSIIEFPDLSITKETQTINGNSILIKTEDEDGEFEGSVEYITNEEGLTTEVIRTNFMNKVDSKVLYEYNDAKQNIKITEQDAKGYFIKSYIFDYDENGNKTLEDELDKKNRVLDRKLYKYESDLLTSIKTANGSIYYHYDNKNLIKEERLNPDSSSEITIYNYENNRIVSEKQYNIPHGETVEETFLSVSKRYIYE